MMYPQRRVKSIVLALLLGLVIIGIAEYASARRQVGTSSRTLSRTSPPAIAYGVNVDMTAMIPGTPYTVKTASGGNFFDLAA